MGKRYRWDVEKKALVLLEADWVPTARQVARADVTYMDGVKTIDGIDISSKRKRREYMKAYDVVDATDFSPAYLEGVKKERERTSRGSAERWSAGLSTRRWTAGSST